MASTPTTPKAHATVSTSPMGTWHHPRIDEINKRIIARTFNESNVQTIVWNSLAFLATFVLPHLLHKLSPTLYDVIPGFGSYTPYIFVAVRCILGFNIASALRPLYSKIDELSDIPLTPSQRSLLGLPPSNTPLTPGSQYITPPRYARSTPRSGHASLASSMRGHSDTAVRSANPSPLASRGRDSVSHSPSPFGRNASPFLQRKVGADVTRRLSYGSQSPVGVGALMDSTLSLGGNTMGGSAPGTPTPARGASVGLNNKWLYERGRTSPSGRS